MNKTMMGVMLATLICITMVAPAMAQPSPFVITGHVSDSNGDSCNDPCVRVTNVNTGVSWDAENAPASNYYRLVLDSDDVSEGNVMGIDASGCLQSKVTHETVSQDMIDGGGFIKDVTLEGDDPPPQQPDIVITGKYETRTDETFTVTYTVANNGAGGAGASTSGIYVNGVQVATDPVPALASGESRTETVGTFDCPCGTTVTVKVCADNDDDVTESDETNNCQENELTCQVSSMSDLLITQKSETWVSMEDLTYSITYTIANTGAAGAIASTTSVTIDGIGVATDPVPALASGERHTNTLGPFTMSGDDDAVRVCADSDDVVSESNEANNCRENTHRPLPPSAMVPALTPFGLLVLIGLLSIFSVMNIKKRGK